MPLIDSSHDGWKVNLINQGPPYHVESAGPWRLPQVCDARGTVALSGPGGAVFQASTDQANALCAAANAGELPKVK